jgi:hypothetical protein
MKPFRVALVAVLSVGGVWGIVACLNQRQPGPAAPAATASEPNAEPTTAPDAKSTSLSETERPPLIGTVRSRSHAIRLYAGRFTVEDANGKVLADLVTEGGFATLLPRLFGEFQQMYAEDRLIADNFTHGKLPGAWSYSGRPERAEVVSAP